MKKIILAAAISTLISLPAMADKQSDRLEFIQQLQRSGYFSNADLDGPIARLWVTEEFLALTIDQKSQFVNVVYAYVATTHPDRKFVVLLDSKSGKTIGHYGDVYGGLEME